VRKGEKEILSNSVEDSSYYSGLIYKFLPTLGGWFCDDKIETLDCGKMEEAGAGTGEH